MIESLLPASNSQVIQCLRCLHAINIGIFSNNLDSYYNILLDSFVKSFSSLSQSFSAHQAAKVLLFYHFHGSFPWNSTSFLQWLKATLTHTFGLDLSPTITMAPGHFVFCAKKHSRRLSCGLQRCESTMGRVKKFVRNFNICSQKSSSFC